MNHSSGFANSSISEFVLCPCLSLSIPDWYACFHVPQFFPRTQMQPPRPTIPSNSPSIRPASQAPNAAVYSPSPPIMMSMTPMPFASPQAAQYYIPQVCKIHQKLLCICVGNNMDINKRELKTPRRTLLYLKDSNKMNTVLATVKLEC